MLSFPPCKINLGLRVLGKRTDGYHALETCFYPVPWNDVLEIIKADDFSFNYSGTPIPGTSGDNLCVRAYELLRKDFQLSPVKIHLHKIIPTGAGLGGGSADGAYTLRLLNDVFSLEIPYERLLTYASILGSDCAFFIQDNAMYGSGRGEILAPAKVSLGGKYMVLIKPDINISTAEAYAGIQPTHPADALAAIIHEPIASWRGSLKNDFETSVFDRHPMLRDIKDTLYVLGAQYASMTGSGSAIFGIFDQAPTLDNRFAHTIKWEGWMP